MPHDVTNLEGEVCVKQVGDWADKLDRHLGSKDAHREKVRFMLYYPRGNRGESEMTAWLPLVTD